MTATRGDRQAITQPTSRNVAPNNDAKTQQDAERATTQATTQASSQPNTTPASQPTGRRNTTTITQTLLIPWSEEQKAMIQRLRQAGELATRIQAAKDLTRYVGALTVVELWAILQNAKQPVKLRTQVALSLAEIRAIHLIPSLQRIAKTRNRYLRKELQRTIHKLCPKSNFVRGKRFYINLERFNFSGPHSDYLQHELLLRTSRLLENYPNIAIIWPNCRRPNSLVLRKHKIEAYFLRLTGKISSITNKTQVELHLLWSSYPLDSMRQSESADISLPMPPSPYYVTQLAIQLESFIRDSVDEFLQNHRRNN